MGLITATFFECGVRYERTTEEGTTKKVNELYIVDALTFSEAESRITEEMQPFVSGDFDVMTLKRTRYSEYDNSEGDKYYKAKIMFITPFCKLFCPSALQSCQITPFTKFSIIRFPCSV